MDVLHRTSRLLIGPKIHLNTFIASTDPAKSTCDHLILQALDRRDRLPWTRFGDGAVLVDQQLSRVALHVMKRSNHLVAIHQVDRNSSFNPHHRIILHGRIQVDIVHVLQLLVGGLADLHHAMVLVLGLIVVFVVAVVVGVVFAFHDGLEGRAELVLSLAS